MKVRLVLLGEAPPRLVPAVFAGLPVCYEAGDIVSRDIDLDVLMDRQRAQVNAADLLNLVEAPPPGWVALGLTAHDLFLPALVYVFGLSPVGERRGLVSWARLRPAGGEPGGMDLLVRRLRTEAAHELGHALGLFHCPVNDCAMHRSLWPEAVDLKTPLYCATCREQLGELCDAAEHGG